MQQMTRPNPGDRRHDSQNMKTAFAVQIADRNARTASRKAVDDAAKIAQARGWRDARLVFSSAETPLHERAVRTARSLTALLSEARPGACILLQYPVLGLRPALWTLCRALRAKGARVFGLVHDLEAIRRPERFPLAPEVRTLRAFDRIIVHTDAMGAWISERCGALPWSRLELWDYLVPGETRPWERERNLSPTLAFAGNLDKSRFVARLGQVAGCRFELFGPGAPETLPPNCRHPGSFPPDEVPFALEGAFGLAWDGDSLEEAQGQLGEYYRVIAPHKVSLYLVSGLPVVVPRSSAVAPTIERHGLGIAVSNLLALPDALRGIDPPRYLAMRANVQSWAKVLAKGGHLEHALAECEASSPNGIPS